jgi:hypothetical protein
LQVSEEIVPTIRDCTRLSVQPASSQLQIRKPTRPTKAVPIAVTPSSRPTRSAQLGSATHLRQRAITPQTKATVAPTAMAAAVSERSLSGNRRKRSPVTQKRPIHSRDRVTARFLQRVFDGALDQVVLSQLQAKDPTEAELRDLERMIVSARKRKTSRTNRKAEDK